MKPQWTDPNAANYVEPSIENLLQGKPSDNDKLSAEVQVLREEVAKLEAKNEKLRRDITRKCREKKGIIADRDKQIASLQKRLLIRDTSNNNEGKMGFVL